MIRPLADNSLIKFEVSPGSAIAPLHLGRNQTLRSVLFHFREFLTFAACFPSAVRVLFGKCFRVCFRFAVLIAFLMFFLAALRCLRLAIKFLLESSYHWIISARSRGRSHIISSVVNRAILSPVRIFLRRGSADR